jgi:hypothetical protein
MHSGCDRWKNVSPRGAANDSRPLRGEQCRSLDQVERALDALQRSAAPAARCPRSSRRPNEGVGDQQSAIRKAAGISQSHARHAELQHDDAKLGK